MKFGFQMSFLLLGWLCSCVPGYLAARPYKNSEHLQKRSLPSPGWYDDDVGTIKRMPHSREDSQRERLYSLLEQLAEYLKSSEQRRPAGAFLNEANGPDKRQDGRIRMTSRGGYNLGDMLANRFQNAVRQRTNSGSRMIGK